ncbi:MAG: potassium channel family protein [Sphingomicrobium sp.]
MSEPTHATLSRKSPLPVWAAIAWRVAFAAGLVVLAVLVHWAERDGLRDNADGHVSFIDVFYFTMISITTTGYGDIVPVSQKARLFDAVVVTPIRLFVVLIFVGTAYSFVFRRTWDKWLMAYIQRNLHDHIVLCGYGRSGAQAVEDLIARGTKPSDIVVIDRDPAAVEQARLIGCAIMIGDATRDQILEDAKIGRAKVVIVSAGRDDTSILMTLTARRLAPGVPISVAVRNHDNEIPARQAGATTVINPAGFAGLLLANTAYGPKVVEYLSDLVSSQGRVKLAQREVRPDEYGKPMSSISGGLGVRIYRDGRPYGFWETETKSLAAGDILVEILPTVT